MSNSSTDMDETPQVVPMRLQKFLARAGVASRRGSEDLMTAGRVAVNGVIVTELGSKVDPAVDVVTVDGMPVRPSGEPVYLILHKPAGFVTTMSDPQGRPTVADLVPTAQYPGLFPVGRLDLETTGLLLFTTDGEMAHRLLHPRHHVAKTYLALVDRLPNEGDLSVLREGVPLDDGMTAPAEVEIVEPGEAQTLMRITIREGRKRQVRRMFSYFAHPVAQLHRISFGPLELGDLDSGKWRVLTSTEIASLRAAIADGAAG